MLARSQTVRMDPSKVLDGLGGNLKVKVLDKTSLINQLRQDLRAWEAQPFVVKCKSGSFQAAKETIEWIHREIGNSIMEIEHARIKNPYAVHFTWGYNYYLLKMIYLEADHKKEDRYIQAIEDDTREEPQPPGADNCVLEMLDMAVTDENKNVTEQRDRNVGILKRKTRKVLSSELLRLMRRRTTTKRSSTNVKSEIS